ncbi:hypothetical protein KP509_19G062000 [Ceratopteris richardii]|uniref:Uncharacterized protein n=1 Tax=Ceratopteris richardii TaxID=49495 RepID=A0A8T2SL18_CERRI|nr:hypothetical protein KP509_19G062000 [Ceratopteris richardii]
MFQIHHSEKNNHITYSNNYKLRIIIHFSCISNCNISPMSEWFPSHANIHFFLCSCSRPERCTINCLQDCMTNNSYYTVYHNLNLSQKFLIGSFCRLQLMEVCNK